MPLQLLILFPPQRDYNVGITPGQDHLAITDGFDGDLIGLRSDLKTKLLALLHDFAVDNREMATSSQRDRGHRKCRRRNISSDMIILAVRDLRGRFPANRPKWAPPP